MRGSRKNTDAKPHRQLALETVNPLQVQFPHVQTVIHGRRQASTKKKAAAWEDAYYLSSQSAHSQTPEQWLQTIRDHWAGVEIRNHCRNRRFFSAQKRENVFYGIFFN